jgi:hypothetical protein
MFVDAMERAGFHITRNHFYSPIPDSRELRRRKEIWEKEKSLAGINFNRETQLDFLENIMPKFKKECDFPLNQTSIPYEYYINNGAFGLVSGATLHSMIRHFMPSVIIEVGSGLSTYVSARACRMNEEEGHPTKLISIEPYPNPVLRAGFPGLGEVYFKRVEEIETDFFDQLGDGDILFIDSSHVVRIGGDVNYLYLEVLPRLKKGVVIHIHDIFFPNDYPIEWVLGERRFWTEQYLLQAFLIHNDRFEVLWCGSYIYHTHLDKLRVTFPTPEGLGVTHNYFSSSFWMRKAG